jgi:hypothetical protein
MIVLQGGVAELPEALQIEPTVVEAWAALQDSDSDVAEREAWSLLVLERLKSLPPEEQLPFLLEADGRHLLQANLRPVYRGMDATWPALQARLLETLVAPTGQSDSLTRGAIQAAGHLASSDAPLIEQLAVLLETTEFSNPARAALDALTGREFADQEGFLAWWAGARELGREAWLEEAHEMEKARELADWSRRLQGGGSATEILIGVRHPRQPIRAMAYEALRRMNVESLDESTRGQVAEALRQALSQESDASLRIDLLAFVPQVLQGREALNPLLKALEFGVESEREAAARYLQLVEPVEVAWEGLLRGLEGVYPASAEGPSGHVAVRLGLWSGLGTLAAGGPAPDPAALEMQIQAALAVENDRAVRDYLLSAIARLGSPEFFMTLRPLVMDPEGVQADRSGALIAMTGIVERHQDASVLQAMLPQLLADKQAQVRRQAIESLRRLKLPETAGLVVERLRVEPEVVLQKELLRVLTDQRYEGTLEPLISFEPSRVVREEYGKALVVQIGADSDYLDRAYAALGLRFDREHAFLVIRKFPREGLNAEDLFELDRKYATAVSELLQYVGVENGNASYAADAVSRLKDLMEAEPQELKWPVYFVELQLMRGEVGPAVAVMTEMASAGSLTKDRRWELGLTTLRFAAANSMTEQGRVLLAALDAADEVPVTMRFHADQVRVLFPAEEVEGVQPPAIPGPEGDDVPVEGGEEEIPADGEPQSGADGASEVGADAGSTEPPKMVADPL